MSENKIFFCFFNSYLMILNISAAELNRNNMRNSSEWKTANFDSSFRLFLCTLLDLCVSSFRLSARLNKLLVSFNELPITFNELAEIGRNWSKLAEIGRNCPKLPEIGRNWPKLAEIGENCPKLAEIDENCQKLAEIGW